MRQRSAFTGSFLSRRTAAKPSFVLRKIWVVQYGLFEVSFRFVVLFARPAHLSEFVGGVRIVRMQPELLLEFLFSRGEIFLRLTLPESLHKGSANAVVNSR